MYTSQKVAIFFGGLYAEHDISIFSFISLYEQLQTAPRTKQIEVSRIYYMMRNGRVLISDFDPARDARFYYTQHPERAVDLHEALLLIKAATEFVYLICDGQVGIDGRLTGLAHIMGLKGTFGSSLAFGLCRSKFHMNQFVGSNYSGIKIPQTIYIQNETELRNAFEVFDTRQIVVKPNALGSSIYTDVFQCGPETRDNIRHLVQRIFDYDTRVIIQEYISGREVGCYCIEENGNVDVLALKEFEKQTLLLETKDKYKPVQKPHDIYLKEDIPTITNFARQLFQDTDCRNLARMDFIIKDQNDIFFLETNSNPALRGMIEAYREKYRLCSVYDILNVLIENETSRKHFKTDFYLDINP